MNGCCGGYDAPRNFLTKEEKIELLSEYKESLQKELKGIEEKIKDLKNN